MSIAHSITADSGQNQDRNRTEISEEHEVQGKRYINSESFGLTALQAKFRRRHINQATSSDAIY